MAFFRSKQGREQLSTTGMDDKDNIMAGIKYNVVFLGSMSVPTPTGHGSSRTESAVDKIYQEKHKPFGYGSKKVFLEISSDEIKVFESASGKEIVQLARFRVVDITYCNSDMKHEKAFVFVVADATNRAYRAYVFHCDSSFKVRELLSKFKEAFVVKGNQLEATRLRSYSAPDSRAYHYEDANKKTEEVKPDASKEKEWGTFQETKQQNASTQRQRSITELISEKDFITTDITKQKAMKKVEKEILMEGSLRNDSNEDEFTLLAEKRLRSFDDQAKSGTGESLLLLESCTPESNQKHLFMERSTINTSKPENENLLQF